MAEQTPNHNLNKYEQGETGWTHSTDMAYIEERLTIADYKTNLETYEPYEKALFLAMDSDEVYEGTGSEWTLAQWEVGELVADYLEAATVRKGGDDVATENWVESDAVIDAARLGGLDRDQLVYNQRTLYIEAEGEIQYHKIADLDYTDVKMYVRCDFTEGINSTTTESWDAYVMVDDGTVDVEWREWGQSDQNRAEIVVHDSGSAFHVYLRTSSWCRPRILTTNTGGAAYDLQTNVSSTDGNEAYAMNDTSPNMYVQFGEVYSQGERVATRDWVSNTHNVSYNDLTDVPSTFPPETHDNSAHTSDYVDADGARSAVDGSDVSVALWDGYELVFDNETAQTNQYIRFITQ